LTDPDDLAPLNFEANDLGIDTIETGGMIAVLMDAGKGEFGDVAFMQSVMDEMRAGSELGRFYAQGTGRVGRELGLARVPVIKNQAISAYDPRTIEVTGITMMLTAQGADHTAGNLPQYDTAGKTAEELVPVSLDFQALCAAADSLGICIFGRSVTNEQQEFVIQAIKDAFDVDLPADFFTILGRDTLKLEMAFNRSAGFKDVDDELPEFFYTESLPPANQTARFHSDEINRQVQEYWS